jgi:hypothetical protein
MTQTPEARRTSRHRVLRCARLVVGLCLALHGCDDATTAVECLSSFDCHNGSICLNDQCVTLASIGGCAPDPERQWGTACGACDNGVWTCLNTEWTCVGATVNQCGGCLSPPATLGTACGPCESTWQCVENEFACVGALAGECGDCRPPLVRPGEVCRTEDLSDGTTVCGAMPGSAECLTQTAPGCAVGRGPDPPECDVCGRQAVRCAADGWSCCDDPECGAWPLAADTDLCGDCGWIPDVVGQPCGQCGGAGRWELDCVAGTVRCVETRNACGGCSTLDVQPGERCATGVIACASPESTVCTQGPRLNACGGAQTLEINAAPGRPCGECNDGTWQCAGPDRLMCVGATVRNACGTCGSLPAEPGSGCGGARVWACVEGLGLVCRAP